MDKNKILEIFNELLEEWESAEDVLIHDRSSSLSNDYKELKIRKQDYTKRFLDALEQ